MSGDTWPQSTPSHPTTVQILTYILTQRSRVLREKLTGLQPVNKFPAFYGLRSSITAFTNARHLALSWACSIQSIPPYLYSWRSISILSSDLRLGLMSGLFPSGFPTETQCKYILIWFIYLRRSLRSDISSFVIKILYFCSVKTHTVKLQYLVVFCIESSTLLQTHTHTHTHTHTCTYILNKVLCPYELQCIRSL